MGAADLDVPAASVFLFGDKMINKITENVTVGSADLYVNGIDVGHLKENVDFSYTRDKIAFKPANMLGEVKAFAIREQCEIRARSAELKLANLKLALGVTEAIGASTSVPSYAGPDRSCSFSSPAADSASWDTMTFGGSKTIDEVCIRIEHTRSNGKKFIVILYKAISMTELLIPFAEEDFTLHDLIFRALADATRAEGDQIGE